MLPPGDVGCYSYQHAGCHYGHAEVPATCSPLTDRPAASVWDAFSSSRALKLGSLDVATEDMGYYSSIHAGCRYAHVIGGMVGGPRHLGSFELYNERATSGSHA